MYTIELDITSEATTAMVNQFATEHSCTAKLIQAFGPAGGNPVYEFSSESFDCLEELVTQYFGGEFDEEDIKTMIVEV